MARTTIDIDSLILKELKNLQKREHRSLGRLVSQLLGEALVQRKRSKQAPSLSWVSRPMQSRVDLFDIEAVYVVLDESSP
jgi:hypothetical protein